MRNCWFFTLGFYFGGSNIWSYFVMFLEPWNFVWLVFDLSCYLPQPGRWFKKSSNTLLEWRTLGSHFLDEKTLDLLDFFIVSIFKGSPCGSLFIGMKFFEVFLADVGVRVDVSFCILELPTSSIITFSMLLLKLFSSSSSSSSVSDILGTSLGC